MGARFTHPDINDGDGRDARALRAPVLEEPRVHHALPAARLSSHADRTANIDNDVCDACFMVRVSESAGEVS